jgi:N-acetylmuramoyl-L-alanine amidase
MSFFDDLLSRARWAWADARRSLRLFWYRADKGAMAFLLLLIGGALGVFGIALSGVLGDRQHRREIALEAERGSLECLARNVYFEARGEPPEGQYAVAEVTMNRLASKRYPDTVCGVVHEQRWDWIRGRYVGAFSWTEFYAVPEPRGEAWELARRVAEDVYYRRAPPTVQGALHFHARRIQPSWAKQRPRVATIGRHEFYR